MVQVTFYGIECCDKTITDNYVGHTINYRNRKDVHKNHCKNPKHKHLKLYQTINSNGGWDNWRFIKLEEIDIDKKDILPRERYWYERQNANLNTFKPNGKTKEEKRELSKLYMRKYMARKNNINFNELLNNFCIKHIFIVNFVLKNVI